MLILPAVVRRVNLATISPDRQSFAWEFLLEKDRSVTLTFEAGHLDALIACLENLHFQEREPGADSQLGALEELRVRQERVHHAIGKCERGNTGELEVRLHLWIHNGPGRLLVMTDRLFSMMAGGVVASAELLKPKRSRLRC